MKNNLFNLTGSLGRLLSLPAAALLTVGLFGCNSGSKTPVDAAGAGDTPFQEAIFAKELGKNQEPVNPSNDFYPTDTIHLSIRFKGRPKHGVASTKFFLGDQLISEAKIDVADVNSGVLFSIGESTFAGFSLTPNGPFPISDKYHAESTFDGKPLGTFKYKVIPPVGSIPSKIIEATMAKNVDKDRLPVDPTTEFAADQQAVLAAHGDIGNGSTIEVNWYVNGALDKAGTKTLTASKNIPDTHFYFAFRPAEGWKPGKQEAVILVDGNEAGRYAFNIQ